MAKHAGLAQESAYWRDSSECNEDIVNRFTDYVNEDAELKAHRDFIEKHVYGFGERAFHWLWHLIVDEMPDPFRFLEIGVYKGQVLSLVKLLADRAGKEVEIVGVTPLSTFAGVTGKFTEFPDDDYAQHITDLHAHFGQPVPRIIEGDSTDPQVQGYIDDMGPFDVVYIDGCHEYNYVISDLLFYGKRLKEGGLLVVDDSANHLAPVWGFFQGIEDVSNAVRVIIETDFAWGHLLAVMHNRVWVKRNLVGRVNLDPVRRFTWVGGPDGNVAKEIA